MRDASASHLSCGLTKAREDYFGWCNDNWSSNWGSTGFNSDVSKAGEATAWGSRRGGWDSLVLFWVVSTKEVCEGGGWCERGDSSDRDGDNGSSELHLDLVGKMRKIRELEL
jgi:hypothetical protein